MESAIAEHLRCPRTRHRRIEDDYAPPYPAWSARAPIETDQVVMGFFGVQSRGREMQGRACAALMKIARSFALADGPGHHDLAHHVDAQGFDNMVAIAYWRDPAAFERWCATPEIDDWWRSDERLGEGIGYFREIASPRAERYETLRWSRCCARAWTSCATRAFRSAATATATCSTWTPPARRCRSPSA